MPTKRAILAELTRDELRTNVDYYELEVEDHYLSEKYAEIRRLTGDGGRNGLNLQHVRSIRVAYPPLPEQRKIATILSSVDDTIEKTQAVIDQVQVVKRGLMQELLTRGLPGRHTRFKQTAIGEIPEDWVVDKIGQLGQKGKPAVKAGTVRFITEEVLLCFRRLSSLWPRASLGRRFVDW